MQLDLRRRAVMGTFLFNPAWVAQVPTPGFQSRSIWASAPTVFQDIWPEAKSSSPVAALCGSLTLQGLLYVAARVESVWRPSTDQRAVMPSIPLDGVRYESPLFAPTEAGMQYLLTSDDFDHRSLVELGIPRGWRKIAYDAQNTKVSRMFEHFVHYTVDERDHLIGRALARRRQPRSGNSRGKQPAILKGD